jgi:hypothetical protein
MDEERAKYMEENAVEHAEHEVGEDAGGAGGGMFQGISDAVVASEWNSYWHAGWRIRGRAFLRSKSFNFFVFICTFYAILGLETAESTSGSSDFLWLHICSFICFVFFSFEIVFGSMVMENYIWSFFWALDGEEDFNSEMNVQDLFFY